MRILIAEDDLISNQLLGATLARWGYEVLSARDGHEAWSILDSENPPSLVILDWMMPGMSGLQICRKLRERKSGSYAYVLLLTGKQEREDVIEGLQAGADDYIAKPFDPQELKVRLDNGQRILRLESELMESLTRLKESEALRQTFVANLTHDLRTPLLAERRTLELFLSKKDELNSKLAFLLETMVKNNDDLLNMVNLLLETYQYEAGKIRLKLKPVDLALLTEECFVSLFPLAESRQIQLSNHIPTPFPQIMADLDHLKRVLCNLMGNALTNIREGCEIVVSARLDGEFVEIEVRDNGPGISEDILPHLFERYFNGFGYRRKIGSGLGLFICKTIVELHGGSIRAESVLGRGTSLHISLPRQSNEASPVGEALS